eukprot:761354-Hanusia_phi.AAC.1
MRPRKPATLRTMMCGGSLTTKASFSISTLDLILSHILTSSCQAVLSSQEEEEEEEEEEREQEEEIGGGGESEGGGEGEKEVPPALVPPAPSSRLASPHPPQMNPA